MGKKMSKKIGKNPSGDVIPSGLQLLGSVRLRGQGIVSRPTKSQSQPAPDLQI